MRNVSSLILIFLPLLIQNCKSLEKSEIKTFDLNRPPVADQKQSGFCWAYTTTGFLETLQVKNTGDHIDLSEEYIGIHYILDQIHFNIVLNQLSNQFPKEKIKLSRIEEGGTVDRALYLIDKVGIVPKSVIGLDLRIVKSGLEEALNSKFNKKYYNSLKIRDFKIDEKTQLADLKVGPSTLIKIRDDFWKIYLSYTNIKQAPENNTILDTFSTKRYSFPQKLTPNRGFRFRGKNMNAKSFGRYLLRNVTKDFQSQNSFLAIFKNEFFFKEDKADDSEQLIEKAKQKVFSALERGVPVPLAFPVLEETTLSSLSGWWNDEKTVSNSSRFKAPVAGQHDAVARRDYVSQGFHVVLVVDVVNEGGRPGKMSPQEIEKTRGKPLKYFIVRNSYGKLRGLNPFYKGKANPHKGYYIITADYLKKALDSGLPFDIMEPILKSGNSAQK